jgi:hypothetical protein
MGPADLAAILALEGEKKDLRKGKGLSKKKAPASSLSNIADESETQIMLGSLVLGAAELSADAKTAEASFDIQFEKSSESMFFAVDMASGKLAVGTPQTVKFTFATDKFKANAENAVLLNFTGQWVTAQATITLKGGASPSAHAPNSTVKVLLKAHIQ